MITEINKLLGSLGMAGKANKLISGETLLTGIKKQKVFLVITSIDMGPSQLKKITDKCVYYKIPCYQNLLTSDQLNQAIGKNNVKAIGVIDKNFKILIEKNIGKGDVEDGR